MVDGVLTHRTPTLTFRRPPPPLKHGRRPFRRRGRMLYFSTEALGPLSDLSTLELTRFARRCSPVRVLEDDVALPLPNVTCDEANRRHAGRTCHTFERVWFTTVDGTNPFANGRDYRMVLDPGRTCEGGSWLYPRDHLRIVVDSDVLAGGIEIGGLRITIVDPDPEAEAPANGAVRLQVRTHQAVRLDDRLALGPQRLPVDPPIEADDHLAIDLINKSGRFLLLTDAQLITTSP